MLKERNNNPFLTPATLRMYKKDSLLFLRQLIFDYKRFEKQITEDTVKDIIEMLKKYEIHTQYNILNTIKKEIEKLNIVKDNQEPDEIFGINNQGLFTIN